MSDDLTGPADEQENPTPEDDAPETEADTGQAEEAGNENESDLEDLDLSQAPTDPQEILDWAKEQDRLRRADYTRKTQQTAQERRELAEQREQVSTIVEAISDPKHPSHAAVMAELGLEFVDDDSGPDFEDDDPVSRLEQRVAAFEASQQQQQQTVAQQQAAAAFEGELADRLQVIQNAEGREFNDKELRFILNYEAGQDGFPDLNAGVAALKEWLASERKSWADSKKNPPRAPGGGVPGSRELDITDSAKRQELGVAAAQAAMRG